jgi:hypothetical protein
MPNRKSLANLEEMSRSSALTAKLWEARVEKGGKRAPAPERRGPSWARSSNVERLELEPAELDRAFHAMLARYPALQGAWRAWMTAEQATIEALWPLGQDFEQSRTATSRIMKDARAVSAAPPQRSGRAAGRSRRQVRVK